MIIRNVIAQALEPVLWGQVEKPVFERIFDVSAVVEDLGVPTPAVDVAPEQRQHEVERFGIPGKDDVRAAGIECKSLLEHAAAMAAWTGIRFEDLTIVFEMGRNGKP